MLAKLFKVFMAFQLADNPVINKADYRRKTNLAI